MAYQRKIWKNRISEFFNRYRMEDTAGNAKDVFLTLNDGVVTQEGDALTSEQLNDLEARIQYGFETSGGIGNCNPNLIDNPWFTIDSRGQGVYSSNGQYTFDRWLMLSTDGEVSHQSGTLGVNFVTLDSTKEHNLEQILSTRLTNQLKGSTVVLSMLLGNGTIASATGTLPSSPTSGSVSLEVDLSEHTKLRLYYYNSRYFIRFTVLQGAEISEMNISCKAVKLEFGEISTIAYDPVPNEALEAAKCKASTADADPYANQKNIHTSGFNSTENGQYSRAIGERTVANDRNSVALGYESHANLPNSVALGKYGSTQADLYNSTVVGIGGERADIDIDTQDTTQSDFLTQNMLAVHERGNLFMAGSVYLVQGKVDGRLIANPDTVVLEDGAIYMLYTHTRLNTGAYRGQFAYMISATFNPNGTGTSTTAQGLPTIANVASAGTVGCNLARQVEPYLTGAGTTAYHSKIGIGCCTTACRVRYTLVKVSGSEDDFGELPY